MSCRRRCPHVPFLILLTGFLSLVISSAPVNAQAVYGSVPRENHRRLGRDPAWRHRDHHQQGSQHLGHRRHRHRRRVSQGTAAAGGLRDQERPPGIQAGDRQQRGRRRGRAGQRGLQPRPGRDQRERRGDRGEPAAQDGPGRHRDDVRVEADHGSAGARPQLHEVHPADARHAAAAAGATPRARIRRARRRRW